MTQRSSPSQGTRSAVFILALLPFLTTTFGPVPATTQVEVRTVAVRVVFDLAGG